MCVVVFTPREFHGASTFVVVRNVSMIAIHTIVDRRRELSRFRRKLILVPRSRA